MGGVWSGFRGARRRFYSHGRSWKRALSLSRSLGVAVSDVLYVAVTIVVFALLFLLVKGVERLER
jgi:hypothetical protein